MSKAILEFSLPEEKEEFQIAVNAMSYKCALDDVYQQIFRRRIKYEELDKNTFELIETMKKEYFKILDNYEIKE